MEKNKKEKISLTKDDLRKLPLDKRYKLIKGQVTYNATYKYIITPGIINKNTNEDNIVLSFKLQSFIGCCGSTNIGEMRFNSLHMINNSNEEKEYIMNLMLESPNTNNVLLTDTTDIDESNSIFELIKLVQPELKPIDSYFNENSGNTVIIYSYNKESK
jgi:hypothetical protein